MSILWHVHQLFNLFNVWCEIGSCYQLGCCDLPCQGQHATLGPSRTL
jgi:hypothetical protein